MIHSKSYAPIKLLLLCVALTACDKNKYQDLLPQRRVLKDELTQPTAAAPPVKELLSIVGHGEQALVTADLTRAPAIRVLEQLLEASGRAYIFDRIDHIDPITVHFCDIPLSTAIHNVVQQSGLSMSQRCSEGHTLWYFSEGNGTPVGHSSKIVSRSFSPTYASVQNLMQSLFSKSGLWGSSTSAIKIAAGDENNQLFIHGPEKEVRATLQMLQAADQPNCEIVIDTYFILIDRSLADQLALKVDLQAGPWSLTGIGNQLGTETQGSNILSGTINALFSESVRYPLMLKNSLADSLLALIQVDSSARVSRGELHVASGQSAKIHVGDTGYILMTTFSRDVPSVSQRSVKTGLQLSVTAQALPGELIRLKVSYEDSAFLPNAILSANKKTNKSETILQVASGQPLLLGGLVRHDNNSQNIGYRHLHSVPILNALSEAHSQEHNSYHAAFVIVPRISYDSRGTAGISQTYSQTLEGDTRL